jgi:hypothetical protein
MLSILIPTYNYNCVPLVKELHRQLIKEKINFEIICLDDGSFSNLNKENEKINTYSNATFKALTNNIGRSSIRNLLASKAKYEWLFFLDADVFPSNQNFIRNYISCFSKKKNIYCGGITYKNDGKNELRIKYGRKYEDVSLEKRKANSDKYFFSSNFLINNEVFSDVLFEETLVKYGKEDLLFSIQLKKNLYNIIHFENKVYHLGIDKNNIFISKTKNAMENLVLLEEKGFISYKEIFLLKLLRRLETFKMIKVGAFFLPYFEKQAITKSSIFHFNLLKISYLCFLKLKTKR